MKLRLLLLLCVVVALPACALQDDDPDTDDLGPGSFKTGYLSLVYDQHGTTTVNLSLAQQPASWNGIQQALAQMLHCSSNNVRHPDQRSTISRNRAALRGLTADERRKFFATLERQSSLELQGRCFQSTQRSRLAFSSTLDTTNLVTALHAAGLTHFAISIVLPDTPYLAFTGIPTRERELRNPIFAKFARQTAQLSISLDEKSVSPQIGVSYGWSKATVARTITRVLVFLLLPIAIVLWMRAVSLESFKNDPTTAWFAYMKTLGWCTNGGMLLWYLTNLGARKDLESLLNFVLAGHNLSIAINLTTYFLPAAIIYLSCISISHRVFVEVKNAQVTWTQFLAEHSVTLARTLVPIVLFSVAIHFYSQPNLLYGIMFAAWASLIVLGRLKLKITKNYPRVVLAGELRDRVFGFARALNVKLQQVIILPAQRMQIANAFASSMNTVIFTDFLLERMSKREVDAIAGHELTHLKRSHPAKLQMAMLAAIFAPLGIGISKAMSSLPMLFLLRAGVKVPPIVMAKLYAMLATLSDWGIDAAIVLVLAFAAVYALSRRFERQADAGAVALTKDPEAMITALLKLNALNLTPLHWGKGTGASLTHPSTLKRIQRIAKQAGISNAQVQELIGRYSTDKLSHVEVASIAEQHKVGEHYGQAAENVVSHKTVTRTQNIFFTLIALMVVPPAVTEFAVEHLHLSGPILLTVLGLGLIFITGIYFLAMKMLPLRGLARQKVKSLEAIEKGGMNIRELETCMVGFAPGPAPRVYLGKYNFDLGALILSRDRMVFLGRQMKFSVNRRQVLSIQTGAGTPSWWPQSRIYVRWQDANGKEDVFSFGPLEPCSLLQLNARVRELYSKLLTWRLRGQPQQLPANLETLPELQLGEVTCKKPRELLGLKVQFGVLVIAAAAIWIVSSILGISTGYLWLALLVLRLFEVLPYIFYREPKQEKTAMPAVGKAATVSV